MKQAILAFIQKHFPALDPFHKLSLEEIIQLEMKKHIQNKEECEHVIKMHTFQHFMADANLRALVEWTGGHHDPLPSKSGTI